MTSGGMLLVVKILSWSTEPTDDRRPEGKKRFKIQDSRKEDSKNEKRKVLSLERVAPS